jgi:hypothetical protein
VHALALRKSPHTRRQTAAAAAPGRPRLLKVFVVSVSPPTMRRAKDVGGSSPAAGTFPPPPPPGPKPLPPPPAPPAPPPALRLSQTWPERHGWLVFFAVVAVAALSRFYRLDQPAGVVFDETHFGKFTGWYLKNMFYFDIHPPLGKLTFWTAAKLLGYDAYACEFVDLNLPYAAACRYYLLRAVSATYSTAAVALLFAAARGLGASVLGAALAALLMVFDGLGVGEGRLILMDAQLIFWLLATLVAAQAWWARLNAAGAPGGARMSTGERYAWCTAIGVLCACAIGIKMTGLVTPALVALESYLAVWTLHKPVPFRQLLYVLAVSLLTYSFWFAWSFTLMTHSSELKMEEEFMTPLVRRAPRRARARARAMRPRRPQPRHSPVPRAVPSLHHRQRDARRERQGAARLALAGGLLVDDDHAQCAHDQAQRQHPRAAPVADDVVGVGVVLARPGLLRPRLSGRLPRQRVLARQPGRHLARHRLRARRRRHLRHLHALPRARARRRRPAPLRWPGHLLPARLLLQPPAVPRRRALHLCLPLHARARLCANLVGARV